MKYDPDFAIRGLHFDTSSVSNIPIINSKIVIHKDIWSIVFMKLLTYNKRPVDVFLSFCDHRVSVRRVGLVMK